MKTTFLLKTLGVLVLLAIVIWTLDFSVNRFKQISVIDSINVSSSTNPTDGGYGTSTNGYTNLDGTSTNPDTNSGTNSQVSGGCFVGGCSGHICSDQKDIVSTCEYREEYACYRSTVCERQANGSCGWTQTPTLNACLVNANNSNPNPIQNNSALVGTKWSWVKTTLSTGATVQAPAGNKFVLTLKSDKTVQSTTDCNSLGGNYVLDGEVLSFGPFVQTMMYCEGSKEADYSRQLSLTSSYVIAGDELKLNLYKDYGTMIFKKI